LGDASHYFLTIFNPLESEGGHSKISIVEVPRLQFAMVDGRGDPNVSEDYQNAVQWLYSVSYGLKFMAKKELGRDYAVMPLEGLWWAQDMSTFLTRSV
jgi:hypothetical protein